MSHNQQQRYYELFAQTKPPADERPRVLQTRPHASQDRDFTPDIPPNYPWQRQVFAEYSLWGPPNERAYELTQPGPVTSSIFNQRPSPNHPPIQIYLERDEKAPQMSPMMSSMRPMSFMQSRSPMQNMPLMQPKPTSPMSTMSPFPLMQSRASMQNIPPTQLKPQTSPMSTMSPFPLMQSRASMQNIPPTQLKSQTSPISTMSPFPLMQSRASMQNIPPTQLKPQTSAMSTMRPTPLMQFNAADHIPPTQPKPLMSPKPTIQMTPMPLVLDAITEEVVFVKSKKPELAGLEEAEPTGTEKPAPTRVEKPALTREEKPLLTQEDDLENKIIQKGDLYADCSDCEENLDTVDSASISSASSNASSLSDIRRTGSTAYPWANRTGNKVLRRFGEEILKPVKMEKGASMMQRMGWIGGGLGRDGQGIVNPVEPNLRYAISNAGFGIPDDPHPRPPPPPPPVKPKPKANKNPNVLRKNKKANLYRFRTNLLKLLLEFVENDKCIEMYFDMKLTAFERLKIHVMVGVVEGDELPFVLPPNQRSILNEIMNRKRYLLQSESQGKQAERQLCVYKIATEFTYLVTPDCCRPCDTEIREVDEDTNPFLKSIKKHIRANAGSILEPTPPYMFDKLVIFFIEFCEANDLTEFRFLGPYTEKEINVIDNFMTLISDLSKRQKPCFEVPVQLLDVFSKKFLYYSDFDPNNSLFIKKVPYDMRMELNEKDEERRHERIIYDRGCLQNSPYYIDYNNKKRQDIFKK